MEIERRVQEELTKRNQQSSLSSDTFTVSGKKQRRFPFETENFAVGAALVDRQEFVSTFDTGGPPPLQPSGKNQQVYLLYQTAASIPNKHKEAIQFASSDSNGLPPVLDVPTAISECTSLNIIYTKPMSSLHQCVAIVGQYESNHILRYMRMGDKPKNPLERVGRGMRPNGINEFPPPNTKLQEHNWQQLVSYFTNGLPQAKEELKPIVERMTGVKTSSLLKNNDENASRPAIIAMVSNLGQADLLTNFVCTAGDKMDLSRVLVFCTDEETLHIAQGLGLNAYYNDVLFGEVASRAAVAFGDQIFVSVMWAKVVAVHVLQQLGVDVLFQDADVVWNPDMNVHPLDLFTIGGGANIPEHVFTDNSSEFDILLVDDGARNVMFAPYAGNSGFYYVRTNDRTKWLFTSFIYIAGDLMYRVKSHQQVLSNLMSEHATTYGLRVKTMSHHPYLFGGYEYNSRTSLMKDVYRYKKVPKPLLFHMCWTQSHVHKKAFMKQMGFWQVNPQCADTQAISQISQEDILSTCCAAEPLVECFYSDKPSVIPCSDKAPLDKGKHDFWK